MCVRGAADAAKTRPTDGDDDEPVRQCRKIRDGPPKAHVIVNGPVVWWVQLQRPTRRKGKLTDDPLRPTRSDTAHLKFVKG